MDIYDLIIIWTSRLSFHIVSITDFPQLKKIIKSNHQDVSQHVDRCIKYSEFWTINIVPFHTHFGSLHFQLVWNKKEFDIKRKAIDVHDLK